MSLHIAVISLPAGLSFVFGLLSDTTDVLGLKKRFYILLAAALQIVMSVILTTVDFESLPHAPKLFAFLVTMIVMARTIAQPIVDSLMIVQMKRDEKRGAEDLETFGHICEGFGAVFYSIFGGYLITKKHSGIVFFNLTLWIGVMIAIAGLVYPKASEDHHIHDMKANTVEGFNFKIKMIKQFLNVKEIRNTLIFFFIVSFVCPNLEEFFVYYNESLHHLRPIFEGYTSIALGGMAAILVLVYNTVLMKRFDLRTIVLTASSFRVLSSVVGVYQTKDAFAKARVWLMIQAIFIRSVVAAYLYMPGMVFFTKMVPHQIEASMLGIAMSIIKFNSEVLGRVWVYFLNLRFDVTINDYQNLWKMYVIQAFLLVVPFFFYKLIINRTQVELVQVVVHYTDRVTRSNIRQTV